MQFYASFPAIALKTSVGVKYSGRIPVYAFLMGGHFSGNDGMFFCHHRSVHFPVGLSTDKKRAGAKTMQTAYARSDLSLPHPGKNRTALLVVLGHLTDKRYRVALS